MKNTITLATLLLSSVVFSQPVVNIIPQPAKVEVTKGSLTLDASFTIMDEANAFKNEIDIFSADVKQLTGISFAASGKKTIQLIQNNTLPKEGYTLSIDSKSIKIAGNPTGVFYGLQSLYQLISGNYNGKSIELPQVKIEDAPASYTWRGMHLDVCRHFFTKEEVKKYIDYMAMYKLNTFHWHLTEDQGWRIEIKKYPLLTSVGAKRSGTHMGPYSTTTKSDNIPYEGFYTQDDIKEVVAYATARHITIVPEIEMPGHAVAALSGYPEFSCTGGPFEPVITWGVFDDVFCAGNEGTFQFLEDVISEVVELFPGTYIHVGGDECPKTRWKTCAKCQQRIKDENLHDEHELQSYFITRMEKFINSKGKQIIGWDEILEGGLAPNASVMSWRGTEGGIAAASQKHGVVMSPEQPCYLNHYQSKETEKEPLAFGGYNPLSAVYNYNPTPTQLSPEERKYILGAQGNMWSEYIPDFKGVEYMAFPRMCAMAETLWTNPEQKDYTSFVNRLKKHSAIFDARKINYAKHFLTNP